MSHIKNWLSAARLRTLPLGIAGVLAGIIISLLEPHPMHALSVYIAPLGLLTAALLQVLSNFANDYGDGLKGTDNDQRLGPQRALQSGAITPGQMLRGIYITVAITALSIVALLYLSFNATQLAIAGIFIVLGGASIWAAIKYTVGQSAYGYRGLGDVFVFIFFGLVAVLGMQYLLTGQLSLAAVLLGISIGCLSSGVLNLNNLRDVDNDAACGKRTLVVIMGYARARYYHAFLVLTGVITYTYVYINHLPAPYAIGIIPALLVALLVAHLIRVFRCTQPQLLDPELKRLALTTLALVVSLGLLIWFK